MNIVNIAYTSFRFYLAWLIAFPLHMLGWCFWCLVTPPSRWGNRNYWWARTVSLWAIRVSGIPMHVTVTGSFPMQGPVVVVANHQSYLDIVAIVGSIPRQVAFVAKKELSWIPFIGWHLRFQGHVLIDRGNPKQARDQLLSMVPDMIAQQKVVAIFPEGTRSKTGVLGRFKSGAFELAHQSGAPVVPVYIEGSGAIFGKSSHWVTPGRLSVTLGPPISSLSSAHHMKEAVQEWFDRR